MKRSIFIFILLVIGLTAYAVGPIEVTSDDAGADGVNQYEIEISSAHDSGSVISCDNVFDDPVKSVIFTRCNNIHWGHVRTINRCMRSVYRYNRYHPIAFLKNGKIMGVTFSHSLQSGRDVFCFVKLSGCRAFIRLRKLLI